ncbi:hypothetical protein [Ancylobacter terrae]|uniref:hypothetical protein n=1 Tax=Ancylobacter sp. sgz301288 TaxID=3342077 RepID=UPI0038589CB4
MTPEEIGIVAANHQAAFRCAKAGLVTRIVLPDGSPVGSNYDASARSDVLGTVLKLDHRALPAIELASAKLIGLEVEPGAASAFIDMLAGYGAVCPVTVTPGGASIFYFRRSDDVTFDPDHLPAGIALRAERSPAPGAASRGGKWQPLDTAHDLIRAVETGEVPELPAWLGCFLRGEPLPMLESPAVVLPETMPTKATGERCGSCRFFRAGEVATKGTCASLP